jgi:hypothetical protein
MAPEEDQSIQEECAEAREVASKVIRRVFSACISTTTNHPPGPSISSRASFDGACQFAANGFVVTGKGPVFSVEKKVPHSPQTIDASIRSRIYRNGRGWVFTPKHLKDLGSDAAIDSALRRLRADGTSAKDHSWLAKTTNTLHQHWQKKSARKKHRRAAPSTNDPAP